MSRSLVLPNYIDLEILEEHEIVKRDKATKMKKKQLHNLVKNGLHVVVCENGSEIAALFTKEYSLEWYLNRYNFATGIIISPEGMFRLNKCSKE